MTKKDKGVDLRKMLDKLQGVADDIEANANGDADCDLEVTFAEIEAAISDLKGIVDGDKPIRFGLKNMSGAPVLDSYITMGSQGLSIGFYGYGECTANTGEGSPVFIEANPDTNIPTINIWSDINEQDPTHAVSLEKAAESLRDQR